MYNSKLIRINQILNSFNKYATSIDEVKGLGFCVFIDHAKYVAEAFNNANIPSMALYSGVNDKERDSAKIDFLMDREDSASLWTCIMKGYIY